MRNDKNNLVTVLAFDPGIHHTGWSVLKLDRTTNTIVVGVYGTIEAVGLAKKENKQDFKVYGNVISFFLLEREITNLMNTYKPDYVVCENAFMAKFPNAFVSLKLCINCIQRVLYGFGKILHLVAPKEAKKAIGNGTADKEAVQNSIQHLEDLKIKETKQRPLGKMVEHEADSIAIGYSFIRHTLPDILLTQDQTKVSILPV